MPSTCVVEGRRRRRAPSAVGRVETGGDSLAGGLDVARLAQPPPDLAARRAQQLRRRPIATRNRRRSTAPIGPATGRVIVGRRDGRAPRRRAGQRSSRDAGQRRHGGGEPSPRVGRRGCRVPRPSRRARRRRRSPAAPDAERRRASDAEHGTEPAAIPTTIPVTSTVFWLAPKVSMLQRTIPPGVSAMNRSATLNTSDGITVDQPGQQLADAERRAPRRPAPAASGTRRRPPRRGLGHGVAVRPRVG